MFKKLCYLACVLLFGFASANADTIFTLNADGCTGTCGTAPFGTVTLSQTTATTVTVTEVLKAGEAFVATGAGDSLLFNLSGDPSITIGFLTTGFRSNGPDTASTFGSFDYSVTCGGVSCGPGASRTNPGPLSFTVTDTGGVTIADFIANSKGAFFASDIIGTNGKTGNVGSDGPGVPSTPPAVPEPSSLLLLGTGLIGAATMLRRRLFS